VEGGVRIIMCEKGPQIITCGSSIIEAKVNSRNRK